MFYLYFAFVYVVIELEFPVIDFSLRQLNGNGALRRPKRVISITKSTAVGTCVIGLKWVSSKTKFLGQFSFRFILVFNIEAIQCKVQY